MKKSFIIPSTLAILLFGYWAMARQSAPTPPTSQLKKNEKELIQIISELLDNIHYSNKSVNDDISKETYKKYLETLDFNKQYFIAEDINLLQKHELLIDDEIKSGTVDFYFKANNLINKRLAEVETMLPSLFETAFSFESKESFETDPEKRTYAKSVEERKAYWREYAKYLTMVRLANKLDTQKKDKEKAIEKGEEFEEESKEILEEKARKQVLKNLNTRFKRRKELDEEDQFSFFINSLNSAFGPHTQYFPPQERENFDMRMTGRLEGIGAQLSKENEYIKVVSIVVGSASWRQGELKENDLIVKVGQGEEEPIDIVDATMKEAIKLIRGPKGTEVRLTVKKPSGEIVIIPIERDVVVQEETYAKSAIINTGKGGKKIGYIYLPSFYSTFGTGEGRRSAKDIRLEIERVQAQKVDGIILDLRNNGGGSLQDAVDMAGHFIDKGPVVQVKDETNPPRVYGDRRAGEVYDGPLLVMINNYSASASEILAGALKDYKRAVIVGSHSFGKGTVQNMLDLNRYAQGIVSDDVNLGALKITIQQFYRINGASTQLKGVHPDIYLPNEFAYMETGIKAYDNALAWDSISPADYTTYNEGDLKLKKLINSSKKRIDQSTVFNEVISQNITYKKEREETQVILNLDTELENRAEFKANSKAFKELYTPNENWIFESLQEFKPEEEEDVKTEKKERWEKLLKEDFYLAEAVEIMTELTK